MKCHMNDTEVDGKTKMRNIKFNTSFYTKDDRGSSCP